MLQKKAAIDPGASASQLGPPDKEAEALETVAKNFPQRGNLLAELPHDVLEKAYEGSQGLGEQWRMGCLRGGNPGEELLFRLLQGQQRAAHEAFAYT